MNVKAGSILAAALTLFTSPAALSAEQLPGPDRQLELVRFVRQECGFCHGLRLTGGLGSPLTAAAMRTRPAETLETIILYGIPGNAMPPWRPYLSDTDVRWIVTKLQEGFPE